MRTKDSKNQNNKNHEQLALIANKKQSLKDGGSVVLCCSHQQECDQQQIPNLAPKFKHQNNCCQDDIERIRQLLLEARRNQPVELRNFHAIEFKRLMTDDWLITRFLLRGTKEAARALSISTNNDNNNNNNNQLLTKEYIYEQTMKLIDACANFKLQYQMASNLKIEDFPLEWTQTEGVLVHGYDRNGNVNIYMRCQLHKPKLIDKAELRHLFKRLLLFHLAESDIKLTNKPGSAICCIFDMTSASLENLDLELLAWMVSSFKHCSPKLLAYVIIYNLPWLFNATFRLLTRGLLSRNHQQGLRFVYGKEIINYIERVNLPRYLCERLEKK